MAKTKHPDPLSRRHLLEREIEPSKASAIAKAYLDEGREIEAIDFFAKAEDRDALMKIQEVAVERGDVFLMKAASEGLGEEASTARWEELARRAGELGRNRDAESALRLANVDA